MTRGVLANTVISSGAACRYGADGKRAHDTLSREIFHRNVARTIRGGDFSTPLRFGRNDGRAQAGFSVIWGREISPLRFASVEMTREALATIVISSGAACRYGADGKRFDDTLSREISLLHASCTIGGSRFLRFASVEMTIGVSDNTVISSGEFMRRLSRGVLFCPLHRGGKGTRFVRKQSDLRIV